MLRYVFIGFGLLAISSALAFLWQQVWILIVLSGSIGLLSLMILAISIGMISYWGTSTPSRGTFTTIEMNKPNKHRNVQIGLACLSIGLPNLIVAFIVLLAYY